MRRSPRRAVRRQASIHEPTSIVLLIFPVPHPSLPRRRPRPQPEPLFIIVLIRDADATAIQPKRKGRPKPPTFQSRDESGLRRLGIRAALLHRPGILAL